MMIANKITKLKMMVASDAAILLYLWMNDQKDGAFTQGYIVSRYGISKRATRHLLYILIDAGLVSRNYQNRTVPLYYQKPLKRPSDEEIIYP